MKHFLVCIPVKRDQYIGGLLIKLCDACGGYCWVCLRSLIVQSENDPSIICGGCFLKKKEQDLSSHVKKIQTILQRLEK